MFAHHPIVFFVLVVVGMVLLGVSLVSFQRLCNRLSESGVWRGTFEKSSSWLRINDLTIFEWKVWWALMSGRLANSESEDVRRLARLSRCCFFVALILGLALAILIELEAPVSFLSVLFS